MRCPQCGTSNGDAQRYCQRCAIALGDGPPARPAGPLPAAISAAISAALPLPRMPPVAAAGVPVLMPGQPQRPACVMPAVAANSPRAQAPSAPAARRTGPRQPLPPALAWGGATLLASMLMLWGAQALWSPRPAELLDGLRKQLSPEFAPPAPEPASPAADAQTLTAAINAVLQGQGVTGVEVVVAEGGLATVSGRIESESDRQALLGWLGSQQGVTRVMDRLQRVAPDTVPSAVPSAVPDEPAPAARQAPAPEPSGPGAAAAPPRPEAQTPPRPAARMPGPLAAERRQAPAAPRAEPLQPDAGALRQALQRELARLGLNDVNVEVDPGNLQITLRGKTSDATRKGQALAAARAAHPGARVRDLIFVVEE